MSRGNQLAAACAELIGSWHEYYGVAERPRSMDQKEFDRHRQRLEYFRDADLSHRTTQEEIAAEQQSGAVVPQQLWDKLARQQEIVGSRQPQNPGEAPSGSWNACGPQNF